jgi:hypothetical protein
MKGGGGKSRRKDQEHSQEQSQDASQRAQQSDPNRDYSFGNVGIIHD